MLKLLEKVCNNLNQINDLLLSDKFEEGSEMYERVLDLGVACESLKELIELAIISEDEDPAADREEKEKHFESLYNFLSRRDLF